MLSSMNTRSFSDEFWGSTPFKFTKYSTKMVDIYHTIGQNVRP